MAPINTFLLTWIFIPLASCLLVSAKDARPYSAREAYVTSSLLKLAMEPKVPSPPPSLSRPLDQEPAGSPLIPDPPSPTPSLASPWPPSQRLSRRSLALSPPVCPIDCQRVPFEVHAAAKALAPPYPTGIELNITITRFFQGVDPDDGCGLASSNPLALRIYNSYGQDFNASAFKRPTTVNGVFLEPGVKGDTLSVPLSGSLYYGLAQDIAVQAKFYGITSDALDVTQFLGVVRPGVYSLRYSLVGPGGDSCCPRCTINFTRANSTYEEDTATWIIGGANYYDTCRPTVTDNDCRGALGQCRFSLNAFNLAGFTKANPLGCRACTLPNGVRTYCGTGNPTKYCCALA